MVVVVPVVALLVTFMVVGGSINSSKDHTISLNNHHTAKWQWKR